MSSSTSSPWPAFMAPYLENFQGNVQNIANQLHATDSHFFDESRYNEAELRKALNQDPDIDAKIKAMKQILAAISYGRDCGGLFPDVVKNVGLSNGLELKKLTYIYLVQYAEAKPQLALLSINSFQKDLGDRSQVIRASALRAMSAVRTIEIIQIVMKSIRWGGRGVLGGLRSGVDVCVSEKKMIPVPQCEIGGAQWKGGDRWVEVVYTMVGPMLGVHRALRNECIVSPRALVPRND